jgi:hypothetical protein
MELKKRTTAGASVEPIPAGWRLSIPAGEAGRYRLAQLDSCSGVARKDFPYQNVEMSLRARVSSTAIPGTWGFGVWNDPFRTQVGPGESILQALTLPNAAWFFFSSGHSHLSFRDDKPGNGRLAQVFRAARFPLLPLAAVAGTFIFSRVSARRRLSRLVEEEAVRLELDLTGWHEYRMTWKSEGVQFRVDGEIVLETALSPKGPLGAVVWIDNQYAGFTPKGRVYSGTLKNEAGWMEVEGMEFSG